MPPRTMMDTPVRSQALCLIVTGRWVTVTLAPGWPQAWRNAAGTLARLGGELLHAVVPAAASAMMSGAMFRPGLPFMLV